MDTTPYWQLAPHREYPALSTELEVDVLVVGGGITGLTAAYLLKQAGRRVLVAERGRIGSGETGHTTAHLTQVIDLRLSELIESFGENHAKAVWEAGEMAIERVFQIASEARIECGLSRVPAYLVAGLDSDLAEETNRLLEESRQAGRLGFDAQFVDSAPIVPRPGIRFSNQAEFHPLRYLQGLAAAVHGGSAQVCEMSEVGEFEEEPRSARVNGQRVRFSHCVLATHVPLQGRSSTIGALLRQTKLAAYSTYAVGSPLPKGAYPRVLVWDTSEPYLYLRIHERQDDDYLIVGGGDHKTGQGDPQAAYERLARVARAYVSVAHLDRQWSGQVVETPDGLPYIGETEPGEFVATGFAGNGMTFGTVAGVMAHDWVLGQRNPWSDLFCVTRKKLSAAWDYLTENKDYPFYLARQHLSPAETDSMAHVRRGEGCIVKLDGRKCAVHRKDDGSLVIRSAICPHLGCVVAWNGAEKTWDCPCHGSRFQPNGEVIAGPAEEPLAAVIGER